MSEKPKAPKPPSKTRKKDWRDVQRRRRFREFYLETGAAVDSALAAGYSPITAKTHAWRMAAAAEETLRDQCDLLGIDKLALIRCLQRSLIAKEPRWNSKAERWDLFENNAAQLNAYDRLKEILEPIVPKAKNSSIKVGVAVSAAASTQEAWLERNKGKVGQAQALGAGAVVTVTVEQSESGGANGGGSVRRSMEATGRPAVRGDNGEVER